jgi:DNA-binding HxlR family transcriptional regulator
MAKKKNAEQLYYETIDLISKKWVLLILHVLAELKEARFSDIARSLPEINTRMLSERLTELEGAMLVERVVENAKPVVVKYRLTKKAIDLNRVFVGLIHWSNKWTDGEKIPKH